MNSKDLLEKIREELSYSSPVKEKTKRLLTKWLIKKVEERIKNLGKHP